MLKIRLQRVGRKNIVTFRIVLTESQNSTKSGKYLEVLGTYDPVKKNKVVNADRVRYWISKGAKPSETLNNFFIDQKIVAGKKTNVLPLKSKTLKRKELKAKAGEKKTSASATPTPSPAPTTDANPAKESEPSKTSDNPPEGAKV